MYTVSNDFKKSINAITRTIKGYCIVKYNDVNYGTINKLFQNLKLNISNINDVIPTDESTPGIVNKYATLEENYFITNGEMILPNDPSLTTNKRIGYISQNKFSSYNWNPNLLYPNMYAFLVNTNGGFNITNGITVMFEEDYPIDYSFYCHFQKNGEDIWDEIFYYNNDKNIIIADFSDTEYYKVPASEIQMRIYKFSNNDHRVRISGIALGPYGLYKDKELISFNTNEETDITNESI